MLLRNYMSKIHVPKQRFYLPIQIIGFCSKKAGEEKEHFKEMLPEEESVRFEEMFRLYSDIYNMELFAHFEYGFKLGGRIALELASDDTKKVFFQ